MCIGADCVVECSAIYCVTYHVTTRDLGHKLPGPRRFPRSAHTHTHTQAYCYSMYEQATHTHTHTHTKIHNVQRVLTIPENTVVILTHCYRTTKVKQRESYEAAGLTTTQDRECVVCCEKTTGPILFPFGSH